MTALTDSILTDGAPLFGAAYYPEYFPPERVPVDLELMEKAGVSVIRVGESVWSTWEPRDGEFELEWLRPSLDEAHRRGIRVVLGTPTYAIPPWLQKKHPELAAERSTGVRVPWGGRQEVDIASPLFRQHAERVIRAVVGAYHAHPAVIGYQVDNEPGLHLLHNEHVFHRFVDELREQFGTVEALNEAWGLVYWSHRLSSFDELWRPDGNTLPQYDLAWRRFQASLTSEFLHWQADIVREFAAPEQFVTTCVAYSRPAVDDVAAIAGLDVTSANLYYGMQDHLALGTDLPRIAPWTTTGVHGVLGAADRAYGTAQAPFFITETNAQAIGSSNENFPPYPGQLRQAALALVARGAAMIEYWHWNTIPYGTETYWGGVVPHSGQPGRIYAEIAELGHELRRLGPALRGFRPEADVALVYSNASRWAFDFFPPITDLPAHEPSGAYDAIFSAFHRGVVESGRQAAIVNDVQLRGFSVEDLAARHPILVVPALYTADDNLLRRLVDYAEAGGHLVLGIRTGAADTMARVRTGRQPGLLSAAAGVWYEEFSNLRTPVGLSATGSELALSAEARATAWADGLIPDGADVLARYAAPFDRFAAITSRAAGDGRISYVGTVPNPTLAADLARWLAPTQLAGSWLGADGDAAPFTVLSGRNAAGDRVIVIHNWSGIAREVTSPTAGQDGVSGAPLALGDHIRLEAWDARVFVTPPAR